MTVVDLAEPPPDRPPPPPPPPSPEVAPTQGEAKAGVAGAPAPKAEAAPLAAAIPVVQPTLPAAIVPATGPAPVVGAGITGDGSGAGGAGNGPGGGGSGDGGSGAGGRGRGGTTIEPQIVRGPFHPSDYPKALRPNGPSGRTWTEVMVGVNGRPLSCRITRSSGTALLDSETCRIIMQRFRFRPGRDAANKPVVAPFEIDIGWESIDLTEQ